MRSAQAGASAAVRGQAARSGLRLKPRRRPLVAPAASAAATARAPGRAAALGSRVDALTGPGPGEPPPAGARALAAVAHWHSAEPGTALKGRDRSSDGTALKEPIKIQTIP